MIVFSNILKIIVIIIEIIEIENVSFVFIIMCVNKFLLKLLVLNG